MKDLRHQHICQLYQVIETDEYYFLVLEVILISEPFFVVVVVVVLIIEFSFSTFVMVNYLIILLIEIVYLKNKLDIFSVKLYQL